MIDALYVYVGAHGRQVARTISYGEAVLVDLDEDGQPVGVEILGAISIQGERVAQPPQFATGGVIVGTLDWKTTTCVRPGHHP